MTDWQLLSPHPADADPVQIQLRARAERLQNALVLEYELSGPDLRRILFPSRVLRPQRTHELWKTTCFEAFVRVLGKPGYWEINLSPSGHWNLYRLDGYRSNLTEEAAPRELGTRFSRTPDLVTLRTTLPTEMIDAWAGYTWELGLCAILETTETTKTHWALTHETRLPDFHHDSGFRLTLPREDV